MTSKTLLSSREYVNQRLALSKRKIIALRLKSVVFLVLIVFRIWGVLFKMTRKTPMIAATLAGVLKLGSKKISISFTWMFFLLCPS